MVPFLYHISDRNKWTVSVILNIIFLCKSYFKAIYAHLYYALYDVGYTSIIFITIEANGYVCTKHFTIKGSCVHNRWLTPLAVLIWSTGMKNGKIWFKLVGCWMKLVCSLNEMDIEQFIRESRFYDKHEIHPPELSFELKLCSYRTKS